MKTDKTYIRHALECIAYVNDYTGGKTFNDFKTDPFLQDAVMRRLEIIGEALNRLPSSVREKHPHIPWREIVAMRNTLIHEYFGVNLDWTWQTVTVELPVLETQLQALLESD